MTTTMQFKGLKELQSYLDQFPAKLANNVMRGALRAGVKPIKEAAVAACPTGEPSETGKRRYKHYRGALRDSIRVSGRIDRKTGKIQASVKAGGRVRKTGANVFYAHWIEYGTRAHSSRPGGKGNANHPGVSPRPFMRPSLDGQANNAITAAAEYIKKRLDKKHGIDTSDVTVEVIEE